MEFRTDLAKEAIEKGGLGNIDGIKETSEEYKGVKINRIEIQTEKAGKKVGKPRGNYITIEINSLSTPTCEEESEREAIFYVLSKMLPSGKILVAGLGNTDITPDAIGPLAVSKIFATRHISMEGVKIPGLDNLREITAIATGVLGKTGLEAAETVKCLCKYLSPDCVIVIDALACSEFSRLGTTVQITDSGIAPGSGVKNTRKELSKDSLGVPVIAIGVPTVIDANRFNESAKDLMVTPRDIDSLVSRASNVLALAINKAMLPSLSFEEIECLT